MIGAGARAAQQPAAAPGVAQAAPDLVGERILRARCARSRRSRGCPPRRPEGRTPAPACGSRAALFQLLLAAHERRRVGDHDAEAAFLGGEPLERRERVLARHLEARRQPVALGAGRGQIEPELGAIDREDLGRTGGRRLQAEAGAKLYRSSTVWSRARRATNARLSR